MRECRTPRDWSLLALQNIRTGKSHYLVICKCPDAYNLGKYHIEVEHKSLEILKLRRRKNYIVYFITEGPMAHDQPTYASVPGIRVFGMMCVKPSADTHNEFHIQRPTPPKRNQYYQSQQSYYNRFKKHTLSKLGGQQKNNENGPNLSTQSAELSSDFTTRGISIIPPNSETREELSTEEEEIPSTTFDASSSSYSTTISSTDSIPTESATDATSRMKRDTSQMVDDKIGDESVTMESRSRSEQDDWPSIPWDEISEQIKNIQWD